MQIKCFLFTCNDDSFRIETKINQWLQQNHDKHIHDIKIAISGNGNPTVYTNYTIMYDDASNVKKGDV